MARIRSIKPDFFINEEIGRLPFEARLLFIGLWTIADREGRLAYRPLRIKAVLFPYDEVDVEGLTGELIAAGLVVPYEVDSVHYLLIPTFLKHQRPHSTERESTLPAPLLNGQITVIPPLDNVHGNVNEHLCNNRKGKEYGEGEGVGVTRANGDRPPPSFASLPPCLSLHEYRGTALAALLLQSFSETFGPTWTMRQTNLGKLGKSIRDGCVPGCDGSPAAECASAFDDIAARLYEKPGLVFHAIAHDPRPWAETGATR